MSSLKVYPVAGRGYVGIIDGDKKNAIDFPIEKGMSDTLIREVALEGIRRGKGPAIDSVSISHDVREWDSVEKEAPPVLVKDVPPTESGAPPAA